MLNWAILKNPVNWLTIPTMAMLGIIAVSLITKPLRNNTDTGA